MDKERTKADEYIIILFGLRWRSVQCNEPDRNSPPANNNKEKTEKGRGHACSDTTTISEKLHATSIHLWH